MEIGAITPHDMSTVQNVQYAAALAGKPYDFFEISDEEAVRAGVWRCECTLNTYCMCLLIVCNIIIHSLFQIYNIFLYMMFGDDSC